MKMKLLSSFATLLLIAICGATQTIDNFLSQSDLQRLQHTFTDGLKSSDLQSIYYSAINSKNIPAATKTDVCKKLSGLYAESKLQDAEKSFYYIGASKSLGCSEKIQDSVTTQLKSSLDKDFTSTQEMFYAYNAQTALDASVLKSEATREKLSKNLLALVKKDDSLQSLGYGFSLASNLGPAASSIVDRIEDAIAQADEVDGKLLQFEGGLSITALIINGAIRVSSANKKPLPLSAEQTKKFTSYFLARRSVTQAKGASLLLESLKTIMGEKSISPIAVRVADNGQITPEDPILKIRINDVLGEALKEKPANVKVTITSKDNKKVVDGENLVPVAADLSLYKIDLKPKQLPKGAYKVEIAAGNYKQSNLPINVLGRVRLEKLEISVSEADSQTPTKKASIAANGKFPEVYNLDQQQKLNLRFDLLDDQTSKVIAVHQAFIRFSDNSGAEIVFVAEQDVVKAYKFEMDVGARASDFAGKSGAYSVDLVIGDASLVNSFVRNLGQINLKFSIESKKEQANSAPLRQARAEIHHQFREPEKRPPRFVSDVFAGLCLAPILILFILWGRLGINCSNFSFSLSALGFHGGLGAIFSLFLCFWLKLDMFQTIQYLLGLSLFTFLCGNRVLRYIATKRLEKQDKN